MRQPRLSVPYLDLYPDGQQEPQKGLHKRMIRCDLFWKDPSGCCVENSLEGEEGQSRSRKPGLLLLGRGGGGARGVEVKDSQPVVMD